jgi:hypothetical protein
VAENQPEGCQNPHPLLGSSMDRRGVAVDSSIIAQDWSSIIFHDVSLEALLNVLAYN